MEKNIDAIIQQLKTQGAMTSGQLAKVLAMTSMGARQHLLRLEQKQLVSSYMQKAKLGRPKQMWQLTEKGHRRFPDRHAELTLHFIDSVTRLFGEQGLEQLISDREQQMLTNYQQALAHCSNLAEQVNKLAELRSQEGYMASVETLSSTCFLLIEAHCPICSAAMKCQNFCRSELAIFQQSLGGNVRVKRQEYLLDDGKRCSYLIEAVEKVD